MKKLVTHNGSFHTDDIFAAATLSLYLEKSGEEFEITRTRDEELIKSADYVFDVGGVYDTEKNRFDHHQKGGAGKNTHGVDYSSFGLVWKKFGVELCGNEEASKIIEKKLVAPLDAHDTGVDLVTALPSNNDKVYPYLIQNIVFSMFPTWKEDLDKDKLFMDAVKLFKQILSREIIQAQDAVLARELVINIYNNTQDKRIIILDNNYPYADTLQAFPEPMFVIYPRTTDNSWGVKAVGEDLKSFKNRKDLPSSWGGLRDEDLQKITGVDDALFCHRSLHLVAAKSKEGAIKLAQIAVES